MIVFITATLRWLIFLKLIHWATTATPVVTFRTTTFPGLSLQSRVQQTRGISDFLPVNRLNSFHVIVLICRLAICFSDRCQREDHHQEKNNKRRLKEEKEKEKEKEKVDLDKEIMCPVIYQIRETVLRYISKDREKGKTRRKTIKAG